MVYSTPAVEWKVLTITKKMWDFWEYAGVMRVGSRRIAKHFYAIYS
jgi:hypothetical protein